MPRTLKNPIPTTNLFEVNRMLQGFYAFYATAYPISPQEKYRFSSELSLLNIFGGE